MKKKTIMRKIVMLFVMCVTCIVSSSIVVAAARIATIKEVKGTVQVKQKGKEKRIKAIKGMALSEKDTIITKKASSAVIEIDEDKQITVGEDTIIGIQTLVNNQKEEETTVINQAKGSTYVQIKNKLKGESKFEVYTPTAVMGVRGTEFIVAYTDKEGTKVTALEGQVSVEIREEPNKPQKSMIIKAGEQIQITKETNELQKKKIDWRDIPTTILQTIQERAETFSQIVQEEFNQFIKEYPNKLKESVDEKMDSIVDGIIDFGKDKLDDKKEEETSGGGSNKPKPGKKLEIHIQEDGEQLYVTIHYGLTPFAKEMYRLGENEEWERYWRGFTLPKDEIATIYAAIIDDGVIVEETKYIYIPTPTIQYEWTQDKEEVKVEVGYAGVDRATKKEVKVVKQTEKFEDIDWQDVSSITTGGAYNINIPISRETKQVSVYARESVEGIISKTAEEIIEKEQDQDSPISLKHTTQHEKGIMGQLEWEINEELTTSSYYILKIKQKASTSLAVETKLPIEKHSYDLKESYLRHDNHEAELIVMRDDEAYLHKRLEFFLIRIVINIQNINQNEAKIEIDYSDQPGVIKEYAISNVSDPRDIDTDTLDWKPYTGAVTVPRSDGSVVAREYRVEDGKEKILGEVFRSITW